MTERTDEKTSEPIEEQKDYEALGDPMSAPAKPGAREPVPQPGDGRREHDPGLGIPDPSPEAARALTAEETEAYRREHEEQLQAEYRRRLREVERAMSGFRLPAPLKAALGSILLAAAALLGLLIVTQSVSFANELLSLPPAARYTAAGAMLVLVLILLYFIGRMLGLYVRLKRNRQINLRAVRVVAERRQMQAAAEQRKGEARKMLRDYLRTHPLGKKDNAVWLAMGFTPEEMESLTTVRQRLLDESAGISTDQWLDEFESHFQSVLDRRAAGRVQAMAVRAGVGTATAPNAMIDQIIVTYTLTALVGDLMRIYNLRPAFGQTAVLLSQGIIQIYVSGQLETATEAAADSLHEALAEWAGLSGAAVLGSAALKAVGARTAEGGLNWLLVRRLGRQTVRMLQPIRRK